MILAVRFYQLRAELGPHKPCRCGQPAVWNVETVFSRESAYVTQPSTRGRRWRKVCQKCKERIEREPGRA